MKFANPFSAADNSVKKPAFRWLAAGSGLHSAGMQGEQVIIGLLVYRLTDSSAWVGISLALFFAPMLFVGIPAGALADRYDRRRVLMQAEVALAVLLTGFALLLLSGSAGLSAALLMSVLSGILRSVHQPARLAYAGDIAASGGLVGTLSLLSIISRLGQLGGAVIAGLASEYFSAGIAYLLLAAGHALAWYCFRPGRANPSTPTKNAEQSQVSTFDAVLEYLRLLRSSRLLLLLILLASMIEVFGFSFATALPQIAVDRLTTGADGLGMMHATRSVGGLFGALLLSFLIFRNLGLVYLGTMVGFGLTLMLLSIAPEFRHVLLAVAAVAVFASASDILIQSMLQQSVPAALRGRAMGAWVVALGMGPIGHLELGFLISRFGTATALLANGLILMLIGILALLFVPSIRKVRE